MTSWPASRPTARVRPRPFFSNYKNEEVPKLLAQARETGDKAKRAELYAKVQDTVYTMPTAFP